MFGDYALLRVYECVALRAMRGKHNHAGGARLVRTRAGARGDQPT